MEDENETIKKNIYDIKKWLKKQCYTYEENYNPVKYAAICLNIKEKLQLMIVFNTTTLYNCCYQTALIYDYKVIDVDFIDCNNVFEFDKKKLKKHIIFIIELFNTHFGLKLYEIIKNDIEKK